MSKSHRTNNVKPQQPSTNSHALNGGVIGKLKSISLLAWLNLFFLLMIITMLLFPRLLPPSKQEREWNALRSAASAPLVPIEHVEKITPQLTFAQILHILPEAEPLLTKYGLLCGTCSIAQYETIEMASRVYDFNMEDLIAELEGLLQKRKAQRTAQKNTKSERSQP